LTYVRNGGIICIVIGICQKGNAMPRPKRCRRICAFPDYWSFAPEDAEETETVLFMLDEFEAVRLIDFEKMTQEECAAAMGVSRATVTGIYESARFKLADAVVNGKRIRITGGAYRIDAIPASAEIQEKGVDLLYKCLETLKDDPTTYDIMKAYLADEEEDLYWSQEALELIDKIGVQNWLTVQM